MEMPKENYVYLTVDKEFINYDDEGDVESIYNPNYTQVSLSKMEIFKSIAFDVFEWEDDQKWRILLEMFNAIYEIAMDESDLIHSDSDEDKLKGEFIFAAKEFIKQIK